MERKDRIIRKVEPVEPDMIDCTVPCFGDKALTNSNGDKVCNLLGVDALDGYFVDGRMNPNLMRKCIKLNGKANPQ